VLRAVAAQRSFASQFVANFDYAMLIDADTFLTSDYAEEDPFVVMERDRLEYGYVDRESPARQSHAVRAHGTAAVRDPIECYPLDEVHHYKSCIGLSLLDEPTAMSMSGVGGAIPGGNVFRALASRPRSYVSLLIRPRRRQPPTRAHVLLHVATVSRLGRLHCEPRRHFDAS
jgi:hypothetical protein